MIGPTLKSKRVVLRPIKASEADQFLQWLKNSEINKFLEADFSKFNLKKEKEFINRVRKSKTDVVFSIYVDSGKLIGNTGFHGVDIRNSKASWGIVIGDKDCWGMGYGQEVIKLILKYCFNELKLNRVDLSVYDFNKRAHNCYVKSGFIKEGVKRKAIKRGGKYFDEIIMSMLKSDYKKLNNK